MTAHTVIGPSQSAPLVANRAVCQGHQPAFVPLLQMDLPRRFCVSQQQMQAAMRRNRAFPRPCGRSCIRFTAMLLEDPPLPEFLPDEWIPTPGKQEASEASHAGRSSSFCIFMVRFVWPPLSFGECSPVWLTIVELLRLQGSRHAAPPLMLSSDAPPRLAPTQTSLYRGNPSVGLHKVRYVSAAIEQHSGAYYAYYPSNLMQNESVRRSSRLSYRRSSCRLAS